MHLYPDGSLGAVIGVFFDRKWGGDQENFFIEQLLPMFSAPANQITVVNKPVFIASFLNSLDIDDFWSYDGSLTTPPCTEGIKWTVLKKAQPISDRQLKFFNDFWKNNQTFAAGRGNNREVQPLNDRRLFYKLLPGLSMTYMGGMVAFIILFVVVLILLIFSVIAHLRCPNCLTKRMSKSDGNQRS